MGSTGADSVASTGDWVRVQWVACGSRWLRLTLGALAAFMMWMMGSGVHIMSMIFTFYQLITPIKGIMGIGQGMLPCLPSSKEQLRVAADRPRVSFASTPLPKIVLNLHSGARDVSERLRQHPFLAVLAVDCPQPASPAKISILLFQGQWMCTGGGRSPHDRTSREYNPCGS